ncbi:MAG: peptidylprolyl isomerase [Leptolyngbya sp. PLA1]|nr:peptidylprolyl isomerase [Leptolyngbya sp. PLA1]
MKPNLSRYRNPIMTLTVVPLLAGVGFFAAPPAAIVAGSSVSEADLLPPLAEAAGAIVLEELTLRKALESELAGEGLSVSPAQIEAERSLLIRTVAAESRASEAQAEEMIAGMRRARGLGESRFAGLLWRNAALRALVAPRATPTPEDMALATQLEFGPRFRARLLVTRSAAEAARAVDDVRAAGAAAPMRFAEHAFLRSIDASGPRGGLLVDASPADGALPPLVRTALTSLSPGDCSDVLSVDGGYAVVLLEARTREPRVPSAPELRELESKVVMRIQRLAMDRLARTLVDRTEVSVMSDPLRWSWERRPR